MKEKVRPAIERLSTYKKYANKWVAISPDEKKIIGSGTTLSKAAKEAKKKGVKNPIFTRIPKKPVGYLL